jgi:DNA-binding MarR family transcriptional regulator
MMSSERSATLPTTGIDFLLAQIGAHAAAKFAERLEPLKLRPAQVGILWAISRENGPSQQALADLLGMFPSRLVLVLDEMERAGLVERRPSPTDRRIYALHLTARGKKKFHAVKRVVREHQEALCAALNAEERRTLANLLARIAEEQQLRPGVHPGYRRLAAGGGAPPAASRMTKDK